MEELDDLRWREIEEELRAEHRHDLHQVLAYAGLFDAPRLVAVLVYPVFLSTWQRLLERKASLTRASLPGTGRRLELALAGIPIRLQYGMRADDLCAPWEMLRDPLYE